MDKYKGTILINQKIGDKLVAFEIDYDVLVKTGSAKIMDYHGKQVGVADLVFEQED